MSDIAVSVKDKGHRKMKRTVLILLALALPLAGGCDTVQESGGGDGLVLPKNLNVHIDASAMTTPGAAGILKTNRVIFDMEAVSAALLRSPDVTDGEEGSGWIWRGDPGEDDWYEFLEVDFDGKYLEPDRKQVGTLGYRYERESQIYTLPGNVQELLRPYNNNLYGEVYAENFKGDEGFDDLTLSEACGRVEYALRSVGVPSERLERIGTYRFEGEGLGCSDTFVFEYRQIVDGIPICSTNWHRGVDNTSGAVYGTVPEMQCILAEVGADGSFELNIWDVCGADMETVRSDVPIISCEDALGKLGEVFSETILIEPVHCVSAELFYAIYETDTRDELILYPLWCFTVLSEKEYAEYSALSDLQDEQYAFASNNAGELYVFDAITGERVNSVIIPDGV